MENREQDENLNMATLLFDVFSSWMLPLNSFYCFYFWDNWKNNLLTLPLTI